MPGARVSQGEQVTLRTVEEEDRAFFQRGSANPAIRVPMGNPVQSRGELSSIGEKADGDQFLVCLDEPEAGPESPEEEEVTRIGWVGIDDVSYRRPDLVYWLIPEVHGEGYGREMLSLTIEYTFRTYDHPAVGAIVYDFNEASRGVLESLGFEEEGRIRRDRFIEGEYIDTVQYGLLREEWRE